MPINKAGKFTYQKQYSNWDIIQAQRQFHAAASQKYLSSGSDALSALLTAFSNQVTGAGDLSAKAALNRIRNATAVAKQGAQGIDIFT